MKTWQRGLTLQSVISVPRRYIFTVDYFLHILTLPSEHLTLNLRPVFSVLPPPRTFLASPTRVTCQCSGSDRCFVIRDFTAVIQSHQQCKPSLRCQDPAENKKHFILHNANVQLWQQLWKFCHYGPGQSRSPHFLYIGRISYISAIIEVDTYCFAFAWKMLNFIIFWRLSRTHVSSQIEISGYLRV